MTTRCELKHTPHPEGYLQHHAWMRRMSKSFRQKKCPECGLWAIWVPKMALLVDCPRCGVGAGTECLNQIYPLRGTAPHKERNQKAAEFRTELRRELDHIIACRTLSPASSPKEITHESSTHPFTCVS